MREFLVSTGYLPGADEEMFGVLVDCEVMKTSKVCEEAADVV